MSLSDSLRVQMFVKGVNPIAQSKWLLVWFAVWQAGCLTHLLSDWMTESSIYPFHSMPFHFVYSLSDSLIHQSFDGLLAKRLWLLACFCDCVCFDSFIAMFRLVESWISRLFWLIRTVGCVSVCDLIACTSARHPTASIAPPAKKTRRFPWKLQETPK